MKKWCTLISIWILLVLGIQSFIASSAYSDIGRQIDHIEGEVESSLKQDPGRCLSQHLAEAIAINRLRQPQYGRQSMGASVGVSDWLILSESIAIPFARVLERWARPLVRAGVDIFCDVVVSMALTPSFKLTQAKPTPKNSELFDPWLGSGSWLMMMWYGVIGSDQKLLQRLDEQLQQVSDLPQFHCMQRHLLESLARALTYAPTHRSHSQEVGHGILGQFLVRVNIVNQLALLPFGFYLDYLAFPVQREGVPLICQDVPHIPRK